jgi:hypothetical protein
MHISTVVTCSVLHSKPSKIIQVLILSQAAQFNLLLYVPYMRLAELRSKISSPPAIRSFKASPTLIGPSIPRLRWVLLATQPNSSLASTIFFCQPIPCIPVTMPSHLLNQWTTSHKRRERKRKDITHYEHLKIL